MATGGLIGALRVTLGIDVSEFVKGTTQAQAQMRRFQKEFDKQGQKWKNLGSDLSKWITVPILGMGAAAIKMGGDFEASMNRVGISTGASNIQLKQMSELALKIGADTSKSASEASDAMDMLAKAGMKTKDILNGGAKAAVDLAIATGSELDPAAAAITDTMAQFKKTAKDLPGVINNITGAVNESKFDFADFQGGMAQAGGVAASSGIKFEEFTAALAGTAAQFASGSDAGTSFKTFVQRLVPDTKPAIEAFKSIGFTAFNAAGEMKPLAQIAQELKEKLSGLSTEDRNAKLKDMFGSDAIRTAIGLMDLGAKGFEDMQARIAKVSATDQAAARMKGFNGQMEQLRGAVETLAIRVAQSGLLETVTKIVTAIGDWVDWMAKASPETLKWATVIGIAVAAVGPFVIGIGAMIQSVGVILPLLAKLGPVITILSTGMGYLIPVIVGVGRALMGLMLNPVGLAIAAVTAAVMAGYYAWKHWDEIKPIVVNTYNLVKTYLLDKLNAVWQGVKKGIDAVKGWFFGMYDAVVGHSYVPDMVDEVGQHMRRLDQEMVKPAKQTTEEAKQAFEQLQQSVSSILARLFPEQARRNTLLDEIKTLEDGMKRMGFTAEQTAEAVKRLRDQYDRDTYGEAKSVDVMGDSSKRFEVPSNDNAYDELEKQSDKTIETILEKTKDKTGEMAQAWAEMARDAVGSMRNMVSSFKSGDILGGITGLLDMVVQVVGAIRGIGGKSTATPTYDRSPRAPGFSTGGSFKVGGSGGVDSQLVRIRATPGEMIDVRRGDQGRREPVIVKVVANDYFDAKVEQVAAPLADRAAVQGTVGGANLANRTAIRRQRSTLR